MIETEIAKIYDPKSVESFWADFWIKENLFSPKPSTKGETYVIVIPPPNVTGSLHMGHALNNTLQDVLIRWKKMSGYETLWIPGTDHGGIATQNVIEKLLKEEHKSRHDLGREKFLERMWQWRKESGDTILMQLRRLGASLDWNRTRFTMDEQCSAAVQHAFVELFKKGLIYRGKRMVNWCVRCHTALSDTEAEDEERKDKLYYIRYPILSGVKDGWQGVPLIVATTRPETMLGDTAVAVNPDDPRYEKIHGWWVQLPLVDREIMVIKDKLVDPKFGTGVVKVTPAHDPADFEMGERHHLERIAVIGFEGKMTADAGKYAGLSREECRKHILEDLEKQNLIEKIEDYHHSVKICYRCNVVLEPLVSDQWFLKVEELARPAAQVVKENKIKISPDSWTKPYLSWMDNLKDWCISRQIWWGHRIPVWYCIKNQGLELKVDIPDQGPGQGLERAQPTTFKRHPADLTTCPPIASAEKPKECPQCKNTRFEQDPDVLDTWFSSGLWPFSVFGWPKQTEDLKKYYPTTVLVTGHEILYLWVARMVMMGLNFLNQIPFSHVFIHGIVRDKFGKKMSKSSGNVIDPLLMIDKYGTDALRFVLTSQSVPGRDMQITDNTFVGARNFSNKIWNVSRFVLMNTPPRTLDPPINRGGQAVGSRFAGTLDSLELCDQWILSRYQDTIQTVQQSLTEYNLAQVSRTLYQFIWSEFCDWYVELSKIRILSDSKPEEKQTALTVLNTILEGILKLLHPIMPFITEEIWRSQQHLLKSESDIVPSLLLTSYPEFNPKLLHQTSETQMAFLIKLITEIRTIRSEMNVPPGLKITVFLNVTDSAKEKIVRDHLHYVTHLAKIECVEIGTNLSKPHKSASAIIENVGIYVPLEGLIDFEKEKLRLSKDLEAVKKEMEHLEKKLSFPQFKTHAPAEEVQRTEQRKTEAVQKIKKLEEELAALQ